MVSSGKTLSCKSNLSHISKVESLYQEDYAFAYHFIREPTQIYSTNPWKDVTTRWYLLLEQNYMTPFDQSFSCAESHNAYSKENRRISYGFNFVYLGHYWVWKWYKERQEDSRAEKARVYQNEIKEPAQQIVFGDMNREDTSFWNHDFLMIYNESATADYSPVPRHTGYSSNFSFSDAHVETLYFEDVALNDKKDQYWDLRE